jgi:hypothetical protein
MVGTLVIWSGDQPMPTTTSISVEADREYVRNLRIRALELNIPMAKLVRRALDKAYGESLENVPKNFADDGRNNDHSDSSATDHAAN